MFKNHVHTERTTGVIKNQQALHHNQKRELLAPIIISMSLMKRLPPENVPHEF